MDYKKSCLYGLKSKRKLFELLNIDNEKYLEQSFVVRKIDPFLSKGVRLAEAPNEQLKAYQRRIWRKLITLEIPKNIFCGMKGKSL